MSEVYISHPNLKAQFSFFKLLIISGIVNIMHAHTEAFRRITDYLGNICNRLTGKVACSLSRRCFLPRVKEVFFNASLYHSPALVLGGGTTAHLRPVNATGYVPALLLGGGKTAHPLRVNTTDYVPTHNAGETENVITPSPSALAKNHDYQHVDSVLQTIGRNKFDITADYRDWIRLGPAFHHTLEVASPALARQPSLTVNESEDCEHGDCRLSSHSMTAHTLRIRPDCRCRILVRNFAG
jgi:hypothetical protein